MTQNFMFRNKGGEYWRSKVKHLRTFDEIVDTLEKEQGLRRSLAIQLARKAAPDAYNAHMAKKHPNAVQHMIAPR